MKLFTSYFYQVRFFKPWQIPLSTAMWDPHWFHDNTFDQSHKFIDKNGVLNGCRCKELVPNDNCNGLCHGKPCDFMPESCKFLKTYRKQIFSLDKNEYLNKLHQFSIKAIKLLNLSRSPELMFIVYESPSNTCSERTVLQSFFGCNEWTRE